MSERQELARDLHYAGVPGDLDRLAELLISRGWTKGLGPTADVKRSLIQDDAPGTVRVGIAGFTAEGAPILGNVARTAAERVAEARNRQAERRARHER